jgi:hypothetical protein
MCMEVQVRIKSVAVLDIGNTEDFMVDMDWNGYLLASENTGAMLQSGGETSMDMTFLPSHPPNNDLTNDFHGQLSSERVINLQEI